MFMVNIFEGTSAVAGPRIFECWSLKKGPQYTFDTLFTANFSTLLELVQLVISNPNSYVNVMAHSQVLPFVDSMVVWHVADSEVSFEEYT